MGKTSLALDITRHVAVELGLKLLSAEADIAAHVTRAAHLSDRLARPLQRPDLRRRGHLEPPKPPLFSEC